MPFALMVVGLLLVVTSARDTHAQLFDQVKADLTGAQNFLVWALAIGLIGALGYIQKLRGFSHAFLALVLLAMFLSNSKRGDILTAFQAGLQHPVTPTASDKGAASQGATGGTVAPSPSGSGILGQGVGQDLTQPAKPLTNADITAGFAKFMTPAAVTTNPAGAAAGALGGAGGIDIGGILGGLSGGGGGGVGDMLGGVMGMGAKPASKDGTNWVAGMADAAKILFMFI